MYLHFVAIMCFGLLIAVGWFYRLATIGFAIAFIYVFLLDRTNYQNHYYLIGLFGCLLTLLPLNRNVSVDAWRKTINFNPDGTGLGVLGHSISCWVTIFFWRHC
jgi:vitamin K-dependent gamma-carboxylase